MTSLGGLLRDARRMRCDTTTLARLLGVASCVPSDGALRALAEAERGTLPRELPIGASLLVGVSGADASLWLLQRGARGEHPMGPAATETLRLALSLTPRSLPAMASAQLLRDDAYRPALLVHDGLAPSVLDGRSYGLSMCVAVAGQLLGLPAPHDLVACAAVERSGALSRVDGLAAKLGVVARFALAVRRVLVAAEQASEARAIAAPLGLEVVEASSLGRALEHAFGPIAERLERAWSEDPERAREAALHLYAVARDGSAQLVDFRAVEDTCRRLAEHLGRDTDEGYAAHVAAHIAARHSGTPALLELREDWLAAQRRPHRLRVLAHLVQHAADAVDPGWEAQIARARAELAREGDEHPDDLRLLGAIGRAHAAWLRYREAAAWLRRAVRGWIELDAAHEASYPLCELLRVTGVEGDREALSALITDELRQVLGDDRTHPASRAYLALAAGRALVQVGDPSAALEWLSDPQHLWDERAAHLAASRRRWLALALRGVVRPDEAAREIPRAPAFAALAVLDAEPSDDARRAAIDVLEAAEPREIARLRALLQPASLDDEARMLTTHFRY